MRPLFLCLSLCLLGGVTGSLAAQSQELPGWVVPVLRLVSTTHVEPTTGVVLSADGLVLVPADFASPGDEIIVLDGGKDIVRDGRPAHLESAFPELGLEVLRVTGLHRRAAPLAPTAPDDGSSVRLRAFPPAEQIAEGAAPLNVAATIVRFPESDTPAIAAESPLPNVTGPLLDECGNLAGLSLADGVQSLSTEAATQYRWASTLREVMAELQLPVNGSPCSALPAAEVSPPSPVAGETAAPEIVGEDSPPAAEPVPAPAEEAPAEEPEDAAEEPEQALEEPPAVAEEMADGAESDASGEGTPPASPWWWLFAVLLLAAGGFAFHRLRRGRHLAAPEPASPAGASGGSAGPGTAGRQLQEDWLPQQPDSQLALRGMLADGTPFEASAPVCADAINLEIGRGGADLVIDSASVSRRHARLNGTRTALTLADLGSSNGSSINGVPCLEGEIMYLEPGDTVILGDVRFTVAVTAAAAPGPGR